MNVVILKSASLSIVVAMICRTVFWIFTGFLHTSMQRLVWLLLSPVADLSSGEPKHALCPTKEIVRGVILPQENQDQQKCFLDDLGALMLSCHRKAQQCTCAWMEVGLLVPGVWFSHTVVRSRYDHSLANILQFLIYWYLCPFKIPMAWKEEVVKWGSIPCRPGTNSSCLIFSKIMEPLLNTDLVRRNAKYRLQKLYLKWSCLKWIFF